MKKRLTNYAFDASSRTLTLLDYAAVDLRGLLTVINVEDNTVVYNPTDPSRGASVAGNVVTFSFDTSGMADTDPLIVLYEDGRNTEVSSNGGMIISTALDKFRDDFLTFDTVNKWTQLQLGSGMAVDVDGVAAGSRYLKISTGVEAGAETILLSKNTFRMPFKVSVGVSLSQRIAEQAFFLEVVEVDDNGNVVTLDTPFTAPDALDARNWAAFIWDGTAAANARIGLRAQGTPAETPVASSFGTNSSVASGSSPNFIQAFNFEITGTTESMRWQAQAVNSATAGTTVKRTTASLNPERQYALRIRARNIGVPASTTDFRLHALRVLDATRVAVDFGIVGGYADGQAAAPVAVVSSATITATANIGANTPLQYADTTANLGAAGTFNGTSRDNGATLTYQRFAARAFSDQNGTLYIQDSTDNSVWRDVAQVAVVAGEPAKTIEALCLARYHRVRYVNGATPTTAFRITSAYLRI